MKPNYEVTIDDITQKKIIKYEENGFLYSFTEDPANSDYQRYLHWLENPDAEESGTL